MPILDNNAAPKPQVSPEVQAQAEKVFQVGDNMLWNKQTFAAIMQELEAKGPVEAVSDAVVMILSKAKELSGGLNKEAAMLAGMMLMGNLVEAINETGRATIDADVFTEALQMAVQKYLMVSQADGEAMDDLPQLMQTFGGGA